MVETFVLFTENVEFPKIKFNKGEIRTAYIKGYSEGTSCIIYDKEDCSGLSIASLNLNRYYTEPVGYIICNNLQALYDLAGFRGLEVPKNYLWDEIIIPNRIEKKKEEDEITEDTSSSNKNELSGNCIGKSIIPEQLNTEEFEIPVEILLKIGDVAYFLFFKNMDIAGVDMCRDEIRKAIVVTKGCNRTAYIYDKSRENIEVVETLPSTMEIRDNMEYTLFYKEEQALQRLAKYK